MKKFIYLLLSSLLICACEKMPSSNELMAEEYEYDDCNVIIKVNPFSVTPIASTRGTVQEECKQLVILTVDSEGKVNRTTQKSDDEDFGTIKLTLASGTYKLIIAGTNSDGSIKVSNTDGTIGFDKSTDGYRPKDVFWYCEDLVVGNEPVFMDATLNRVTALIRFVLTDTDIPEGIASLDFSYTGGSADMDYLTGVGHTNSKQERKVDVFNTDGSFKTVYDLYTIPKAGVDKIKVTITAQDADGNKVYDKVFDEVPVKVNAITKYEGELFKDITAVSAASVTVGVNSTWSETCTYTF